MRIASALLTWPVVALGGLGLPVPSAQGGDHGTGSKRVVLGFAREVNRPGPVVLAPAVGGVTMAQSALLPVAQSALITGVPQSAFIGVPQSAFIGMPQSALIPTGFAQSSIILSGGGMSNAGRGESAEQKSAGSSGGISSGGSGGINSGGSGGTTVCPELSKKIDDLAAKVDRLDKRVDDLDRKVDELIKQKQQQEAEKQRQQDLQLIQQMINASITENNKNLVGLLDQMQAKNTQALVSVVDELIKPEKDRNMAALRERLLNPPTMVPPKK